MTPKYEVINYCSSDDQSFIAEAPELAGCMADGKTHAEALTNSSCLWANGSKQRGSSAAQSPNRAAA